MVAPAVRAVAADLVTAGTDLFAVAAGVAVMAPAVRAVHADLAAVAAQRDAVLAAETVVTLILVGAFQTGLPAVRADAVAVAIPAGLAVYAKAARAIRLDGRRVR